jgi:hypothetical protein
MMLLAAFLVGEYQHPHAFQINLVNYAGALIFSL